jgi:hypothetical protein
MSIKLMMEVNRAHERLDTLEKLCDEELKELIARIEKCEGEIRAMKARAGKIREVAEI